MKNNSEMESVKVDGTVWNEGDITAKNLTGIVIFTDTGHNKEVRKNIPLQGNLPPDKGSIRNLIQNIQERRPCQKRM